MDLINHIHTEVPWLDLIILVISTGFVFAVFNYTVLNDSAEQPISFNLPIPEQCNPHWKGEVLEEPSIKVRFSSTGQHQWH